MWVCNQTIRKFYPYKNHYNQDQFLNVSNFLRPNNTRQITWKKDVRMSISIILKFFHGQITPRNLIHVHYLYINIYVRSPGLIIIQRQQCIQHFLIYKI